MKKLLFFTLAFCLFLSACSAPANQTNPTSTVSSTAGQSSGIDFTTGNLNGVNLAVMGDSAPMPGFDAQNMYAAYLPMSVFQETDTVFFGSTMYGNLLYYYDKVTGSSDFLCANPACEHTGNTCGAWTSAGASAFYYNGQRWWIASKESGTDDDRDHYLYRSDLSGLNQERVKRLAWEDIILTYQPQQFAIHRGNLYFLGAADLVEGETAKKHYTLQASPLDGTEEFAILFDYVAETSSCSVRFVGTKVYFSVYTAAENNSADLTVTSYDLASKEYKTVCQIAGIQEAAGDPWVTEDGEIFLGGQDDNENAYIWKLKGDQRVEIASWTRDNIGMLFVCDGVVVTIAKNNGVRRMEVRDFTGKLLASSDAIYPAEIPGIEGDPNTFSFSMVGGNKDKIILSLREHNTNNLYIVMIDLQDGMKVTRLWGSGN